MDCRVGVWVVGWAFVPVLHNNGKGARRRITLACTFGLSSDLVCMGANVRSLVCLSGSGMCVYRGNCLR